MISQSAEYALRAAVFLAGRPGESQTLPVIAGATEVPAGYLSKVLQVLRKAGVVRSRRGKHGGFQLGRAPKTISLYDVVAAFKPISSLQRCPLVEDDKCPRYGFHFGDPAPSLCPLHELLNRMSELVEGQFRELTLDRLADGHGLPHVHMR